MTFEQVRNAVVSNLEQYIECSVDLSDQIAPKPEYPLAYYTVLAPRISRNAFGCMEVVDNGDERVLRRHEPVYATMSFTFCSQNREVADGSYIFGEDEALELAEKAHCFFLLAGHCITTEYGDIVVNNVGNVANRSNYLVEDMVRRYGFDVRISYVRVDEVRTGTIQKRGNSTGTTYT